MKLNRTYVLAGAVAAIAVAAGLYLHSVPQVGSPCQAGQGAKTTLDGKLVECVAGTWNDPAAEDWHKHGPLHMSALIERLVPRGYRVDWRASENPVVDTEAAWKSGFLMRTESADPVERVFNALLQSAEVNNQPLLVPCWDDGKKTVIIDHKEAAASLKNCKR